MHEIELKPSRLLGLLLLLMVVLVLVAIHLAALPRVSQWLLGTAVLGLALWSLRRARRPHVLRVTANGALQCLDGKGAWRDAQVVSGLVTPVLIVLRYRGADRGIRSLTLLPDSAAADDLRRLRVLLRWAARTRLDTSSPGAD